MDDVLRIIGDTDTNEIKIIDHEGNEINAVIAIEVTGLISKKRSLGTIDKVNQLDIEIKCQLS